MIIRPPGPRGHWLAGSLPELRGDMLGLFERSRREFGDIVLFRLGLRRTVLISHPDLLEQVLVTDNRKFTKNYALQFLRPLLGNGLLLNEGESWLRQRRIMQPAFSKARIEGYAPAMAQATGALLAEWREGETRDLAADMMRLTMAIAGRTLLDADVAGEAREVAHSLELVIRDFLARFLSPLPLPFWLPTPQNRRLQATIARLDLIILGLIQSRRAAGAQGQDLLSALIHARDEQGQGMTDRQLRDEVMTLFLAGHETTANTLAWAWYLLGKAPAIQEQASGEARRVLGERKISATDLPRLTLCEGIIRESLRLYPAAFLIGRRAREPVRLGDYDIPPGTNVLMSQWVVHRDERWFERPAEFLPERWADGLAQRLPKYTYFPFGGGPRVCIGASFAMQEAVLILASVLRQWRLVPAWQGEIGPAPAITLRPREPIQMRLERRPVEQG